MKIGKTYKVLVLNLCLFGTAAIAVEAVIETEAPSLVILLENHLTDTSKAVKESTEKISIDILVAKYESASKEEAPKIMKLIKQEISHLSQQRQANELGKMHHDKEKK